MAALLLLMFAFNLNNYLGRIKESQTGRKLEE